MSTVNVHRAMREAVRTSAGQRWCFNCRKRLPHVDVLLVFDGDPMDDWYGPSWKTECSRCHGDHTYFPGLGPA